MLDIHTQEQLVFPCHRWLSRDEDDGEICRELPTTRPRELTLAGNVSNGVYILRDYTVGVNVRALRKCSFSYVRIFFYVLID